MLREAARVLASEFSKRVVVVDTSNEIAGDGDIPHPAIGKARRMQVSAPERQHLVMIEAVENHMPEVIVIDEIGTEAEAIAARTIAERGVQLIGTAHGNNLDNLMLNPTLTDLIGGIQSVTLGDDVVVPVSVFEAESDADMVDVAELVAVALPVADAVPVALAVAEPVGEALALRPVTRKSALLRSDGSSSAPPAPPPPPPASSTGGESSGSPSARRQSTAPSATRREKRLPSVQLTKAVPLLPSVTALTVGGMEEPFDSVVAHTALPDLSPLA